VSETDSLLAAVADAPAIDPGAGIGERVDRYRIVRRVGAGTYGVVYEAEDVELGRRVALKVLREDWRGDAKALSRLRQEAITVARLAHPNVVVLYDHGSEGGVPFLVFELIDGASLREWLAAEPRSVEAILRVFRAAGEGLAAAHGAGLIHRDFKPANVLLGRDGTVRVADFGLARGSDPVDKAEPSAPHQTTQAGTPRYMAPEAQRGEPVSARADQYAFFVALEEALGDRCPRWLRPVIARGRQAEPTARFPTMEAVVAALRPPRRTWPWLTVAALSATAVAFAATREPAAPCAVDPSALRGVWDAETRAAVRDQPRLTTLLDGYAHTWLEARADACRATRVSRTQSEHVLDLRMACLDQRRDALALVTSSGLTPPQAVRAATGLPAIDVCAAVPALLAVDPVPPGRKDDAAQIRRLAEKARLLGRLPRNKEALSLAVLVYAWAATLPSAPLEAFGLYVLGVQQEALGDAPGAERTLRMAMERAIDGRDLPLLGRILSYLVVNVGRVQGRWDEAETISVQALAVTREWDPAPRSEANTLMFQTLVASARGQYADALRRSDQTLLVVRRMAVREPGMEGEIWNTRAGILRNLGRRAEGIDAYRVALALFALVPEYATNAAVGMTNLGTVELEDRRWDEAVRLLDTAVTVIEREQGPDTTRGWKVKLIRAQALVGRGDVPRGLSEGATAIAALRQKGLPAPELLPMETEHAKLLALAPGHEAEARAAFSATIEQQRKVLGDTHPDVKANLDRLAALPQGQALPRKPF
jgi:eukaryotic-like serine/threonine-protein kinase